MSDAAVKQANPKQERVEQILGELAELSLMLARDLAVQARAAEDVEQKVALTTAFQKMARTTRLTLALDAKLDRDAARDAREAAREAAALASDAQLRESRAARAAAEARSPTPEENQKRRVRAVLNRLIWNEAEGDSEEYDVLLDDLDHRLWEIEDAPGFADMPIEVLATRLAQDMKLSGELIITTHASVANVPPPLRSGGAAEAPMAEGANHTQPPLADTG